MTRYKFSHSGAESKQLTARQVHRLCSETLQAYFNLDMSNSRYEAQHVWDVLIGAAVERMTIEMACELLEHAPSPNTVRHAVSQFVTDDEHVMDVEQAANSALTCRLPKKLFKSALAGAIDITDIPYHGQHEEDDESVRRGRAKHGTTHFHSYATLYIVKNNKRYTLAVSLMRRSDTALDVLKRLVQRGQTLGLRLKRLYLDRGFDNNAVLAYLKQQPFPTIMPLTIRGKSGGTRALLVGRKSYQTIHTRSSIQYGPHTFPVYVVCKYSKGRYRRKGVYRFAYVVIGALKMPPHQVFEDYRRRFGIETSYRLMNTMRARTTSHSVALRLFFVALALLLINLWSYAKWCHLFVSKRGPRQILHHLLPLARWRLWLWEMVKQRLGFPLSIAIPDTI